MIDRHDVLSKNARGLFSLTESRRGVTQNHMDVNKTILAVLVLE